jgi:hypothetical protein
MTPLLINYTIQKPPTGHKKIRVHLIFDVKHDGRHKARLVADGHLTDIPLDLEKSGVPSGPIPGRTQPSQHTGHRLWKCISRRLYVKVYISAGPEFKHREGHILIIRKTLYR